MENTLLINKTDNGNDIIPDFKDIGEDKENMNVDKIDQILTPQDILDLERILLKLKTKKPIVRTNSFFGKFDSYSKLPRVKILFFFSFQ